MTDYGLAENRLGAVKCTVHHLSKIITVVFSVRHLDTADLV